MPGGTSLYFEFHTLKHKCLTVTNNNIATTRSRMWSNKQSYGHCGWLGRSSL